MKETKDIVRILQNCKLEMQTKYGIEKIGLFGSCARGEQHDGSDVDVCIEGGSLTLIAIAEIEIELEKLLGASVQVTVIHDGLPDALMNNINREVIWI